MEVIRKVKVFLEKVCLFSSGLLVLDCTCKLCQGQLSEESGDVDAHVRPIFHNLHLHYAQYKPTSLYGFAYHSKPCASIELVSFQS